MADKPATQVHLYSVDGGYQGAAEFADNPAGLYMISAGGKQYRWDQRNARYVEQSDDIPEGRMLKADAIPAGPPASVTFTPENPSGAPTEPPAADRAAADKDKSK